MKKIVVCTVCPKGCAITVKDCGSQGVYYAGHSCERGKTYAAEECAAPKRILTASVRVQWGNRHMLPVRTTAPIPKDQLMAAMKALKKITLEAPVDFHQVILSDIVNTGTDVVSCMTVEREGMQ
ncbi:MAG: DUF1667 domain-containing protein [Clostridiales bacterium]|nr:DUF1667 domain-containing protein [Clostridiales bacterium]